MDNHDHQGNHLKSSCILPPQEPTQRTKWELSSRQRQSILFSWGERGHDGNEVPTIEAVGGESSHGQSPCGSGAPLSTGHWGFDIGITAVVDHDSDLLIDPSSSFGLVW